MPHRRDSWEARTGLSRRTFLRGTFALAAGGLTASACGTPLLRAGATAGLQYWNLFGGGDGVRMVEMLQTFEENHDFNVDGVTLAWGAPYYTKLAMSAAGGRSPDVAVLHLSRLAAYAPGGLLDPFDEELLAEYEIGSENFLPDIWDRGIHDGQPYALPLDTHPYIMYYNTAVCEEAGLLDDDGNLAPMEGPDAAIDMFTRAQDVTGRLGLAVSTQNVEPWRTFWSLYRQLDGEVLSESAEELVVDDAGAVEALTFMRQLTVESGVADPEMDYDAMVAEFASGNAGFMWNGPWEVATMLDQPDLQFDMTVFPAIYGNNRCQADSHSFVLPHKLDRDEQTLRRSYEFISGMLQNSLTWARGGHIPAYQPVVTSGEYEQLEPQSHYRDAAESVQFDPAAWFSGSASELENQAGAAFSAVHTGALSPEAGLAQFKAAMLDLINTPDPVQAG